MESGSNVPFSIHSEKKTKKKKKKLDLQEKVYYDIMIYKHNKPDPT